MQRWAVYYAPPADSALWQLGSQWLGRDAETGKHSPAPPGIDPLIWQQLVAKPRHYGLHATLKPPFVLQPSRTPDELLDAVQRLASQTPAFLMPPLAIGMLGDFLALRPTGPCAEINALAERCVRDLDVFRHPLPRPTPAKASAREKALNARWGYPYVLDAFRFHLTLTDAIQVKQQPAVSAAIRDLLGPALTGAPTPIQGIAVYHQAGRDQPFTLRTRFALKT